MMKSIPFLFAAIIGLLHSTPLCSQTWTEREDFGRYFQQAGVEGAFLLYDLENDSFLVHNRERTEKSFIPASTFKIFNSLVALETGVIRDQHEVIAWDSIDRGWEKWNMDLSMSDAFRYSAVWFYQELARRIGRERMQAFLDSTRYGNRKMGPAVDRFWLDGDLRISPKEQIDFLVKLHRNELPFSQRTMDIVREVMIHEQGENYTLRGKTGWGIRFVEQIGWFVGYVERKGKVYFFATNIDIRDDNDAPARIAITKRILRQLDLME